MVRRFASSVSLCAALVLFYMVDYMTRTLRAAATNEVPGGLPIVLPQGGPGRVTPPPYPRPSRRPGGR